MMLNNIRPIPVDFCCNNPDNGLYDGRTMMLEVGPNMSFGCVYVDWGPRVRFLGDRVSFARKHFPVFSHKPWFGNWCWDRVFMPGSAAIELLNWLHPKGWFSLDMAWEPLSDKWERGERWRDDDVPLIAKEFD